MKNLVYKLVFREIYYYLTMLNIRNSLVEMANSLSDEKIIRIYSFAEFIQKQNEDVLFIDNEEILELEEIISKDDYYNENQVNKILNESINV
jgi:hypothetical protein